MAETLHAGQTTRFRRSHTHQGNMRVGITTLICADPAHSVECSVVYRIWRSALALLREPCHRRVDRDGDQTTIMVMSKTLPLSEVKAKLSEVVDEIVTTQERVTVTRNGRPVAVVLSTDDLEAIEETLAILSDPAAMREIQQGRAAIASGDVVNKDDIEALRSQLRSKTA